jgi:hypothetical protein
MILPIHDDCQKVDTDVDQGFDTSSEPIPVSSVDALCEKKKAFSRLASNCKILWTQHPTLAKVP